MMIMRTMMMRLMLVVSSGQCISAMMVEPSKLQYETVLSPERLDDG